MKPKVMVVDDTEGIRDLLKAILEKCGYEIILKCTAAELTAAFAEPQPDVILLDLVLPDGHGLELLPQIKKQWPETEVIVLTGNATFEAAVEATKKGAYQFQNKPFEAKTLILSVERALEHKRLNEEASSLRKAIATMSGGASPIFQSSAMKAVLRTVERVAPSQTATEATPQESPSAPSLSVPPTP